MKTIHTYVCLVDQYRRQSRQRNTQGRYLVGAKTPKEAQRLLRKAIGFGSVQVYYRATGDDGNIDPVHNGIDQKMAYKAIRKVRCAADPRQRVLQDPRHACDPIGNP